MSLFASVQLASAANVVFNVTVPTPTYQCWIVGNFNSWNNNDKQMTMVDATHYTITLDDSTWPAGITTATIQYKYLSGGNNWNFNEVQADGTNLPGNGNRNGFVDGQQDVVAKWGVTYNPTVLPVPRKVTIEVMVPDSITICYLAGSFNSWKGALDSTRMTMGTPSGGSVIFSITLTVPDVNTLKYKFLAGPSWDYEMLDPSADITFPSAESYVANVVNSFKKRFDTTKAGTVKITATVPAVGSDKVWIVGSFALPNWDFTSVIAGVKNGDGTFTFTVPGVIDFTYYCINKLDWNFKEIDPLVPTAPHPDRKASYPVDANTSITVAGWLNANTAVNEVNAATNKIYSVNSTVVVEGVTSNVALFDLSGRLVQSNKVVGTFTSNPLNKGLYIVRVDGATRKVSVN